MRRTDQRREAIFALYQHDVTGQPVDAALRGDARPFTRAIAEGVALVTDTLSRGPIGPYQLQAAIAAVHDEAPTAEVTDWPQILALYTVLERVAPNPTVTLNRAVAVAMAERGSPSRSAISPKKLPG